MPLGPLGHSLTVRKTLWGSVPCIIAGVVCSGCFLVDDFYVVPDGRGSDNPNPGETPSNSEVAVPNEHEPDPNSVATEPDQPVVVPSARPLPAQPTASSSVSPAEIGDVPGSTPTEPSKPETPAAGDAGTSPSAGGPTSVIETDGVPDASIGPSGPSEPGPAGMTTDVPDASTATEAAEAGLVATCDMGWSYNSQNGWCASDCKKDEFQGPNGRCYWFGPQGVTQAAAQSTCVARGAGWNLPSVRNADDDAFIGEHITADTWIGASDAQVPNTWRWIDDSTEFWQGVETGYALNDSYTHWGNGEPSGANDESCARYHGSTGSWRWSDCDCTELYRAACEGPAPADPTWSRGGSGGGRGRP